jgi:DivIVA domain-containing protein
VFGTGKWVPHEDCSIHGPLAPDDVLAKHFRPQKLMRGYDPDEVDDFLDYVAQSMAGFAPPVASMDVRQHEFHSVVRRGSFPPGEVDDFLECIARTLETYGW